jgi:hypothetical protein
MLFKILFEAIVDFTEMLGKEPANLFTTENYLKLLNELRKIADKHGLGVRTVEKAFFKKNIDETTS